MLSQASVRSDLRGLLSDDMPSMIWYTLFMSIEKGVEDPAAEVCMRNIRVRPIHIAYGLLVFFFVTEPLLRQGKAASSLQEDPTDRGSTKLIGATFGLALFAVLVAPLLNWWRVGRFRSKTLAWSGIMVMLSGLALRIWAVRVLGAFYTRILQTSTQQHLVTKGPYRLVRHPGYLADLLMWFGAGFATAETTPPTAGRVNGALTHQKGPRKPIR